MAVSVYYNRVKYTAASAGTGDFVTSASITGFLTPATASIANASIVSYVAFNSTQTEWETGQGAYTSGTTTLARTTVRESSNAGAKVNFTTAPTVALDFQAQDVTNLPPVAINGATLGSNALAVTGTSLFNDKIVVSPQPPDYILLEVDVLRQLFTSSGGSISLGRQASGLTIDTVNHKLSTASLIGFEGTYSNQGSNIDATLSRNAAGVIQFGTTSANAAGSWLAANGTIATGTITTSQPFTITQTWNSGGVTFTGLNFNLTDTASDTTSKFLDLQKAGVSQFNVRKSGVIAFPVNNTDNYVGVGIGNWFDSIGFFGTSGIYAVFNQGQLNLVSSVYLSWNTDTALSRNAAGTIQFGTTSANAAGSWLAANGTIATGTITTSQPFTITQTWNAGGVTFEGESTTVTDTASATLSRLRTWKVGASEVAGIIKDGSVFSASGFWRTAATSLNGANYHGFHLASAGITNLYGGFAANTAPSMAVIGSSATVSAVQVGSTSSFAFCSTATAAGTVDTQLSRNAAGIIQFGTTSANAAGSWSATAGTLSGALQANSANITLLCSVSSLTAGAYIHAQVGATAASGSLHGEADGVLTLANWNADNFVRLNFGGTTSSFGALAKDGAGIQLICGDGTTGAFLSGVEQTAPAAPAANGYRIFAQDNGGGKTQLMVIFASGAAQQIAIQP